MEGFDNYLKPPANVKKKLEVTEGDRLFSNSSGTYEQVSPVFGSAGILILIKSAALTRK
jgi:hypothetical protein